MKAHCSFYSVLTVNTALVGVIHPGIGRSEMIPTYVSFFLVELQCICSR